MTTTVKVSAHLSAEKEVRVDIKDGDNSVESFALQDGQEAERHVYDGRKIEVSEVAKS